LVTPPQPRTLASRPVLAGTVRLFDGRVRGWWLASSGAPAWTLFALVGAAMVAHGLGTALSIRVTRWGKLTLRSELAIGRVVVPVRSCACSGLATSDFWIGGQNALISTAARLQDELE